jgi:hypothetical protein
LDAGGASRTHDGLRHWSALARRLA